MTSKIEEAPLAELNQRLGLAIPEEILEQAVTHRSYSFENGGVPTNERLEFLGDSVLGLVITDELFKQNPDAPEGQLARLRAAVVSSKSLAEVASTIELGSYLRLGHGEETSGGREKASIVADALEGLIGAVYLNEGLSTARDLILKLFADALARSAAAGAGLDWKTSLQELTAQLGLESPEYIVESSGPDHEKSFSATVRVGAKRFGLGLGRTKKEAEQEAAALAFNSLTT
ncbi:MAG: ribonuclease III [Actinobacteria bacterium]|nr:ribonuclease III [Actinomycetota bacterium]